MRRLDAALASITEDMDFSQLVTGRTGAASRFTIGRSSTLHSPKVKAASSRRTPKAVATLSPPFFDSYPHYFSDAEHKQTAGLIGVLAGVCAWETAVPD